MRIQPNLQPGTSQRLAKPPQDRMGTLVLRVARGSNLEPENTCGEELAVVIFWLTLLQIPRLLPFSLYHSDLGAHPYAEA